MKNNIELFHPTHAEQAVFTASHFISLRKKKLKCNPIISKHIILGFFPHLYGYIRKKYTCANEFAIHHGHSYLNFIHQKIMFSFIFIGYGAPLAGMLLDESIALGGENFIFLGPAGSLSPDTCKGMVSLPTSAIRDEGTSFHYEEVSRYSYPHPELTRFIQETLVNKHVDFNTGRNWTTDAIYRETPGKIQSALSDEAITVDMEASALFSIARHYQKRIAGLFLITDHITPDSFNVAQKNKDNSRITANELFDISLNILHDFSNSQ